MAKKVKLVPVEFTPETKRAICDVAQYCAQDMEYEYASDPEVVAETALDAGRLRSNGYEAAQLEVERLCKEFGWPSVCAAAAKFVPSA